MTVPAHSRAGRPALYVRSSTFASGAFFFTDAMPLSREAVDSYISLRPTCPFAAVSAKYGLPFVEVFRS